MPPDAERVVQKESLELDGAKLTTTLKQTPKELPVDQVRVHVMGVSEKTTKDGLISYLEVVSGEEVVSIVFGSNSNVMVTFIDPPGDLHQFKFLFVRHTFHSLLIGHLEIEKGTGTE
jgi:hypothetical protein